MDSGGKVFLVKNPPKNNSVNAKAIGKHGHICPLKMLNNGILRGKGSRISGNCMTNCFCIAGVEINVDSGNEQNYVYILS